MAFLTREKPNCGTNTLRGGKNTYSVKTKISNWVEHQHVPGQPGQGFTTAHFRTNTQDQQTNGRGFQRFGTGLPPASSETMNYQNVICPYKKQSEQVWGSMTQTIHARPDRAEWNEFSTTFRLKGGMTTTEELDAHRSRWIHDGSADKDERFSTVSELAARQSAPARYHTRQIRRLPGLPLAVERVRTALMEQAQRNQEDMGRQGISVRGGFLGAMRQELASMDTSGDGKLSSEELTAGLQQWGVVLSALDMEQVMKYFDSDQSGFVSVAELVAGVRGEFPSSRQTLAAKVFECLTGGSEASSVSMEEIYNHLVASAHPDVLAGVATPNEIIQEYMQQWDMYQENEAIPVDNFFEYYWDLSSMIDLDEEFGEMVTCQWDFFQN